MNKNLLFVAFGLVGAMTTPAEAAVQFCFKHNVDFIDSGLELDSPCDSYSPERCEDRWLDNDAYVARGIKATIQQKVSGVYTEIWSGYVDDGNGTDGAGGTPDLDPAGVNTGWYKLTLESKAKVNGDYVYVRDASNALALATIVSYIGSDNTTYTYSFSGLVRRFVARTDDQAAIRFLAGHAGRSTWLRTNSKRSSWGCPKKRWAGVVPSERRVS